MIICNAEEIKRLANLNPPILDHNILRRSPEYKPNEPIPERLKSEAADKHGQFTRAYDRWEICTPIEKSAIQEALLKKLAQILYVVRSNIAHGEKTRLGPDWEKVKRDRLVCEITRPVLDLIVDVLFDFPSTKLVVYGTLAPGQPNHLVLKGLDGKWQEGSLNGNYINDDGLPVFRWNTSGQLHKVTVFSSIDLPKQWDRVDRFEGTRYKRILVPVEILGNNWMIANLYEGNNF